MLAHSTEISPSKRDDLVTINLSGARNVRLELVSDILELINREQPEVVDKVTKAITTFPEDWPEELKFKKHGQQEAKRAITRDQF